nr:penicillin acylase family protein [Pedococcus cremeus]
MAVSVAALVVVLLVVAAILGVTWVRRPFPTTDGQISIPGLTGKVTVLRNDRGVPQIYADNAQDLFRAQGFVHAQDRFFEMDLRRHITAGRLSEMVGKSGLETDKVIRTMGWRRVAEEELPKLAPETRRYLQAYSDGVNAYIDRQGSPSRMALEYVVLGQQVKDYRVEQWTPADSLAWLKAMAWDLRGDYESELMRARLVGRVPIPQINELFPAYPYGKHKPILSQQAWSPKGEGQQSAASAVPGARVPSAVPLQERTTPGAEKAYAAVQHALEAVPQTIGRGPGVGSNSWVVGPEHSSTGKPLLANDPHLGFNIPGIWYQVGLHCRSLSQSCPFDVSGFSFSGLPGVVIGHNQQIAWGFTNLDPDVTDFYLEQVRGGTYQRDGKYIPLEQRTETIKVAGEGDHTITVRSTVHGPIMSEAISDIGEAGDRAPVSGRQSAGKYEVSLAWTGLVPNKTADAIFGLNKATSFQQFRDAAKSFAVPSQNLVYADRDGHIGYQAPGMVPIRRSDTPGAVPGYWPTAGWRSAWDWKGYVPFDQMPWAYDPPEGMIVTANQAVTASPTPFLTTEWDYGFRAQRIRSLLEKEQKVTPQRMSQIQADTRSEFAATLTKRLLDIDLDDDPFTKEGQDLLRGWDFTNPIGDSDASAAAAYFNAVWSNLVDLTYNDELPKDLRANGGDQWMQATLNLLDKPRDAWWDNKLTPGVTEGATEIMRQALVQARLDLTRELGKDPGEWEWGKLHKLTLKHKVLGSDTVPGPVRMLFNRGPFQVPGGSAIVNAMGWDASQGYDVRTGPSMRMVVDLGNLDRSTWVNATGNSGHAFNDHYDDQVGAWSKNETFPWPFSEKAVRAEGGDDLELVPGSSQ